MKSVAPSLALILIAGVVLGTAACNREPKPDSEGVFVITEKQINEVAEANVGTDFTPEGFAIRYLAAEPTAQFKSQKSYFILNGDYAPVDLLAFRNTGERWEQDPSKGDLRGSLQQSGISGEPNMKKVMIAQHLPVGTYALQVQHGGDSVFYAFRSE